MVKWSCLSRLFKSVTEFRCRRLQSQASSLVGLCRAILKSRSRFLMFLLSSFVTHGLSACRIRIVFVGIACLAAERIAEVNWYVAVSMS